MGGDQAASDLVLIGVAAFQQAHGRDAGQDPRQLRHLGYVGLNPEDRLLGIQTEGEEIHGGIHGALAQRLAVLDRGERVIVDDEAEQFIMGLKLDHALHHGEIVAEMELSRRLDPRQDPSAFCSWLDHSCPLRREFKPPR